MESLVNFIHAEKPQELSNVKTPKHHVTIPAGEQVSVKCNMDRVVFEEKIPVAFEPEPFENEDLIPIPSICLTRKGIQNYITVPVLNRSNHDIILPPSTSTGLVNQVQSITPTEQVHIPEKGKEKLTTKNHHKMAARHHIRDESINKEENNSNEKHVDKILEEIDLSHLSTEQNQKAVDLITEMSDVFCQDSDDIVDVQNCKMKISLKDETPVHKSLIIPCLNHCKVLNHSRVYWPKMEQDIKFFINNKYPCLASKKTTHHCTYSIRNCNFNITNGHNTY